MTVPKLVLFATLLTISFFATGKVYSQTLDELGVNLPLQDYQSAQVGMIVSVSNGVYSLSKTEYDPGMYGVVTQGLDLVLNQPATGTKEVLNHGQVLVLVSTKNGVIKSGDLITTSKDTGIGQKATHSGHVLGKALKDYSAKDAGLVPVILNIAYNQVSASSESLTQAGIDQVAKKITGAFVTGNFASIIKYLFALILGVISFFLGLSHFVRSNQRAMEAIARNPMAKADIGKQLWVGNIAILVACGLGLGLSLAILFLF